MKKRNIFAVLLLSIITLGIYDLYWLYKTKKVLNEKTKIHTPTLWLLFVPILVFVVLIIIAAILGAIQSTNPATASQPKGVSYDGTAIRFILDVVAFISIVPITFYCYWYFKFSKAINEYTSGELSTGVTFILLWILHFIGVMIVQDKFNDMVDAGHGAPVPVASTGSGSAWAQSVAQSNNQEVTTSQGPARALNSPLPSENIPATNSGGGIQAPVVPSSVTTPAPSEQAPIPPSYPPLSGPEPSGNPTTVQPQAPPNPSDNAQSGPSVQNENGPYVGSTPSA